MSNIQPAKIDVVALSPDNQTVILSIAEVEPWEGSKVQLMALSEKLKNYTGYALDGQLILDYPDTDGKNVIIRLDISHDLPLSVSQLIKQADEVYGTNSLKFETHTLK